MKRENFFDPTQEQYEQVADLPEKQQKKFEDTEGGFVQKSALDNDRKAEIAARFMRGSGEQIVQAEAEAFDRERDLVLKRLKEVDSSLKGEAGEAFLKAAESKLDARNAIELSPYNKELCDSPEVIKAYTKIRGPLAMHDMSQRLKNDKEFVIDLLNSSSQEVGAEDRIGEGIGYLPHAISSDPEVILAAMKTAPIAAFSHASTAQRNNLEFIAMAQDAIEKNYGRGGGNDRIAAMNALLELVSPRLKEEILGKRELAQ